MGCFTVLWASRLTVEEVDDGDGDGGDGHAENKGSAIIIIIPREAAAQSVNPGVRLLRLRPPLPLLSSVTLGKWPHLSWTESFLIDKTGVIRMVSIMP